MAFKSLINISCAIASLFSVSANAALVYWEQTNVDVNFVYTIDEGSQLGIFDVDDFTDRQNKALILNADADTIDIVASGEHFSAASRVTRKSITLFNDNQYVLAISDDGTNWFGPSSWSEAAANSNIYSISFSNASVTSIDAVPTLVPVPAAAWLFGSGLLGLVVVARRKNLA